MTHGSSLIRAAKFAALIYWNNRGGVDFFGKMCYNKKRGAFGAFFVA